MQWWRISNPSGSTVNCSFSGDGVNWTQFGTTTVSWGLTSTSIAVQNVCTGSCPAQPGYSEFGNFAVGSVNQNALAGGVGSYVQALNGADMIRTSAPCETNGGSTTLSGATTDVSLNCLKAGNIRALVYRVTTTITGSGVTGFQLGDASTATRFCATQSTYFGNRQFLLRPTRIGQRNPGANAKVRITAVGGSFSGGAIEVIAFYGTLGTTDPIAQVKSWSF